MGRIYIGKNSGESAFISCLLLMVVLGTICLIGYWDRIDIAPNSQRTIIKSARKAESDFEKTEWYKLYLEKYARGRYSKEAECFLLDYYEGKSFNIKDYERLRDQLPGTVFSESYDSLVTVRAASKNQN